MYWKEATWRHYCWHRVKAFSGKFSSKQPGHRGTGQPLLSPDPGRMTHRLRSGLGDRRHVLLSHLCTRISHLSVRPINAELRRDQVCPQEVLHCPHPVSRCLHTRTHTGMHTRAHTPPEPRTKLLFHESAHFIFGWLQLSNDKIFILSFKMLATPGDLCHQSFIRVSSVCAPKVLRKILGRTWFRAEHVLHHWRHLCESVHCGHGPSKELSSYLNSFA